MNIDFPEPTSKSEGINKKMIHVIMQERELKKKRENKRIKHKIKLVSLALFQRADVF